MIPKLVNDRFIKSLGKQKFIIPNNIGEETIIFDNDFFVTIITIMVLSIFITFVLNYYGTIIA